MNEVADPLRAIPVYFAPLITFQGFKLFAIMECTGIALLFTPPLLHYLVEMTNYWTRTSSRR